MASLTKQKKAKHRRRDARLAKNRLKAFAREQRKEAKLPGIIIVR